MKHVRYVCVKVELEIPDSEVQSSEETIDKIVSEMDYNFAYDEDDGKIVDSEIMGIQDHVAIGL